MPHALRQTLSCCCVFTFGNQSITRLMIVISHQIALVFFAGLVLQKIVVHAMNFKVITDDTHKLLFCSNINSSE